MPKIMWILNITPDSFFDWWKYENLKNDKKQIDKMILEWADIIDIWWFSSKPWSIMPSILEELSRILPVLEYLETQNTEVSVDTCRSEILKEIIWFKCIKYINDISWLTDEKILELIKWKDITYILMHILWSPENMQKNVHYENIIDEINNFFREKILIIKSHWVNNIIIDPWFGFWKEIKHNYEILNNLEKFKDFWYPILAWLSRKSMIYKPLWVLPTDVLTETVVLNFFALTKWAEIIRVHDVAEHKKVIQLFNLL